MGWGVLGDITGGANNVAGGAFDLKRLMAEAKGAARRQCLVQISRAKQDVKVKFEYDDPARRSVRADNLEHRVEERRPA